MSSPICKVDWQPVNWGSAVCDLLRGLLLTNEKLSTFWGWMFGDNCKLTTDFAAELIDLLQPIGSGFWAPKAISTLDSRVWVPCDGRALAKVGDYAKLYAAIGGLDDPVDPARFLVPDLKGRMLMAAGTRSTNPVTPSYSVGDVGGEDEVKLEEPHIAEHAHGIGGRNDSQVPPITGTSVDTGGVPWLGGPLAVHPFRGQFVDMLLKPVGSHDGYNRIDQSTTEKIPPYFEAKPGEPHPNMPPYYVGIYYIKANHMINGELVP